MHDSPWANPKATFDTGSSVGPDMKGYLFPAAPLHEALLAS